jgi:hypothetical protein
VTTLEDQTAATLAAVARSTVAFDNHDDDGVMAAMTDGGVRDGRVAEKFAYVKG